MSFKRFKRCIEQACLDMRCEFSEFAEGRSLHDFLIDASAIAAPIDLAVAALVELLENGQTPFDRVVFLAVVQYLDEEHGRPPSDGALQRMRDLVEVKRASPSDMAYARWAESWYGTLPRRVPRIVKGR